MNKRLSMSLLLAAIPLAASAQDCVPSEALWAKPRSGAAVLADPGVRSCVEPFLKNAQASLTLRHLPDEESVSRAEELRWWLIALGLEPGRVGLAEDTTQIEPVLLELMEPK